MRGLVLYCSDAYVSVEGLSLITKCRDALAIGNVTGLKLVISNSLVIIGNGKLVSVLADRLIALSRDAPLAISNAYGIDCFLSGSKYPVLVDNLKCSNTYVRKSVVNDLHAAKAVFNEEVIIKNLHVDQELVFNDPYVWFKKISIKPDVKVLYNYETAGSEES